MDIEEVASSELKLAAKIQPELLLLRLSSTDLKDRRQAVEFVWFRGSFWIDQGEAGAIAKRAGHVHGKNPFRRLNIHRQEKLATRSVDDFEPGVIKGKVAAAESLAEEAAGRTIVAGGRLYERCPEPVILHCKDDVVGVGFAPAGLEEGLDFAPPTIHRADNYDWFVTATSRLDSNRHEGVEILLPDAFKSELQPGKLMLEARTSGRELFEVARYMPIAHLASVKRLYDALRSAWCTPTDEIVDAIKEVLALGSVPKSENQSLRTATNIERVLLACLPELNALVGPMESFLSGRLHPDVARNLVIVGDGDKTEERGVLRRVETEGEVFRCARIAGLDPFDLLCEFKRSETDVVAIHVGVPVRRDSRARESNFNDNIIAGVRLVRAVSPGEPEFHFNRFAEPWLREAVIAEDYPEMESMDRVEEMRP